MKNGGRKEDADDVFQDAILVLYKQIIKEIFNPKYKIFGYLYRLSINYWINKIKKDKRISLIEEYSDMDFQLELPSSPAIEINKNLLETLFKNIGEKCIELLTYTIYNDLLLEDIMLRMGFPSVDAVKMQAQRCKKKILKEIEGNPYLINRLKGNE